MNKNKNKKITKPEMPPNKRNQNKSAQNKQLNGKRRAKESTDSDNESTHNNASSNEVSEENSDHVSDSAEESNDDSNSEQVSDSAEASNEDGNDDSNSEQVSDSVSDSTEVSSEPISDSGSANDEVADNTESVSNEDNNNDDDSKDSDHSEEPKKKSDKNNSPKSTSKDSGKDTVSTKNKASNNKLDDQAEKDSISDDSIEKTNKKKTKNDSKNEKSSTKDKSSKASKNPTEKSKDENSKTSTKKSDKDSSKDKSKKSDKESSSKDKNKKDSAKDGKSSKDAKSSKDTPEDEANKAKIVKNEKEFKLNDKEGGHLVNEKIKQVNENLLKGKESVEKNQKSVFISIRNNSENGTIKTISDDFLRKKDKQFGTTLLEKSKSKFQIDFKELEKEKKENAIRESLKRVSRADQIIQKISLYYCRNKNFIATADHLIRTLKKLSPQTIQKVFLDVLHRAESPYIALFILRKMKDVPPFLSDECVVQLSLFVRSFRIMYLDTIPYSQIIKDLFERCILSDVTVEHSYDLLSQIEQDKSIRNLFIELFGRVHIVNYYKELCAGLFVRNIHRSVLYSVMFTINDMHLTADGLSPTFNMIGKYIEKETVEKNSVVFARAFWAFLKVHMSGFNERFNDAIKYIRYFSDSFTSTSCEIFSIADVLEIVDTIEILANSIINRTIFNGEAGTNKKPSDIKNYVQKKELKSKNKIKIVPEMENVKYSDKESDSDESSKTNDDSEKSEDSIADQGHRLDNVKITQESLLVFITMLNTEYKSTYKKLKEAIQWKKRITYDTLLYALAHIKLLHLLLYLSRLSGSVELPIKEHYSLFSSIDIPATFDGKQYDGTQELADRIFSEKWNSLGFLLKESLISPNELNFSQDILRHKSPHQLFEKVSASVHLLTFPPITVFLESDHIYDAIFLQTLPMYVRHKEFLITLRKIVRTFISRAEKEALALLIRRLIELDGIYTEKEVRKGRKKPYDPNHYTAVKNAVRNTIASLFITEIDLSSFNGVNLTADSRKDDAYDAIDVVLHETKEHNPVTNQEEYKIAEEIIFKRTGTDMHKELNSAKTYHKSSKEGKNVDEKRRRIVFDFIVSINDLALSEKFIKALIKLPTVTKLDDKMKLFIIKVLAYALQKITISDPVVGLIKDFAKKELKKSSSELMADAAKYLYIKTSASIEDKHTSSNQNYENLSLSLLMLITRKQGNLNTLKNCFFKICADLKDYERNELLLLFKEAGVTISNSLDGTSEGLSRYNESKKLMTGFPSIE
ncbi:hypothetical protein NEIRO03_1224 [Nematocida sp. AWRm78]|nr:hypothetical protein NEIRO02_1278 [Nematocida sp. AWRm79]KAI5183644.1 hypothetical protein NEIRO03_1224 [Nematocida sp. AWRm78]